MENLSEDLDSSSEEKSQAPVQYQNARQVWPADLEANANFPFRPAAALVTTQNPPDFSWPFVPGADLYWLELSQEAAMDRGARETMELTNNFFNFPYTLNAGIWYWRVRYHNLAGGWSEWSPIRKFRITESSVPFPVPPINEMLARMEVGHPRVWTNPRVLSDFRARRQHGTAKLVFEKTHALVLASLEKLLPEDPNFPYMDGSQSTGSPAYVKALQDLRKYTDSALDRLLAASFVYLLTGDRVIGDHAKNLLMEFTSWDCDGATRFDINDQVHRAIAYRSSIAYDWVYDLLSTAERKAVQHMVHTRVSALIDYYLVRQPIYQFPFDSHGWTIIGYIGLIGTIMLNDIPDAEDWVRQSIPPFINLLPPWGGEDGSWSQGTGYWQWSSGSNKELMDVLLSAGAINLYDKAFSRNEGLYPLYMFPHGSPSGVFGNDSHYKPDLPSISLLNRMAHIYGDPRMKWASQAIGEEPSLGLHDYIYGDDRLGQLPLCDLPKSKWFPTTGLVAMHDDLRS
ncbi:DUF4962 domain-containing protein [Paenibacillus qinlingensis]|uniref:Heparinase II N-terminal domain-containing protein n=1 Tax=Paenibacillus qinlingensis TaxID=1837343 RepID=A0ABU1P5P9_9BACL|nr:DUF4962 domain-containing protein [Paenibacillus qinlingensis]MDR6555073.1 hypothetical protein [Paenibacillus qinlingensis]